MKIGEMEQRAWGTKSLSGVQGQSPWWGLRGDITVQKCQNSK